MGSKPSLSCTNQLQKQNETTCVHPIQVKSSNRTIATTTVLDSGELVIRILGVPSFEEIKSITLPSRNWMRKRKLLYFQQCKTMIICSQNERRIFTIENVDLEETDDSPEITETDDDAMEFIDEVFKISETELLVSFRHRNQLLGLVGTYDLERNNEQKTINLKLEDNWKMSGFCVSKELGIVCFRLNLESGGDFFNSGNFISAGTIAVMDIRSKTIQMDRSVFKIAREYFTHEFSPNDVRMKVIPKFWHLGGLEGMAVLSQRKVIVTSSGGPFLGVKDIKVRYWSLEGDLMREIVVDNKRRGSFPFFWTYRFYLPTDTLLAKNGMLLFLKGWTEVFGFCERDGKIVQKWELDDPRIENTGEAMFWVDPGKREFVVVRGWETISIFRCGKNCGDRVVLSAEEMKNLECEDEEERLDFARKFFDLRIQLRKFSGGEKSDIFCTKLFLI